MQIAILDYGMGNLLSVRNALEAVGARVRVVEGVRELHEAGAIVLPGVGAFGQGMRELHARGFVDALREHVLERKKPFLGICLGLQLLADRSLELGEHGGLAWARGTVRRLPQTPASLRIPHIGWSEVEGDGALFAGIPPKTAFYFVHSFHLDTEERGIVRGTTVYGDRFVSALGWENVHAVQFHPEKSHKYGLALLKNFVEFARRT